MEVSLSSTFASSEYGDVDALGRLDRHRKTK